jgi:glycerophosphoryl diester phosphodiesterase
MEPRFLTAIVVVIGLVAVGCGSASDDVSESDSGDTPATVLTTTAPVATTTAPSNTSSSTVQPSTSTTEIVIMRTIDVEGHRGARGVRPENTLPSFEAALDAGVDTLELDLHLSHDGQLLIWHDPDVTAEKCRTDDQSVPDPATLPSVRSLTAAELALYVCDLNPDPGRFPDQESDPGDVSAGDYSMMTLPQLFEFVDRYANDDRKTEDQRRNAAAVQFNVETKRLPDRPETIGDGFDGTNPGEFEQALALLIDEWGYENRVVVQSFDHRSLWALRVVAPDVRLAALTLDEPPDFQAVSDSGADIWSPHFTSLSADVIADAQSLGLDVIPWTVNTEGDVCSLLGMGVNGLITDRPDLVLGAAGWLAGCQASE